MGCVSSKRAMSVADAASPVFDHSAPAPPTRLRRSDPATSDDNSAVSAKNLSRFLSSVQRHKEDKKDGNRHRKEGCGNDNNEVMKCENEGGSAHDKNVKEGSSSGPISLNLGLSKGHFLGAEQIAAGWPPWLSTAASEAIRGWIPLRAEAFEKLDKIGQGTYSTVYQAREVETGRMVALKKVRFDTFQPESIRFMAREIVILRRLDHPNIMKLEGIITSRMSTSLYLVFEYMEHDLSGLLSSSDINFSEAQIKCYMKQLLRAIEHCHRRGIMHRDIKSSNILVNNEGILKLGDFGLANVLTPRNKQQLTSRVVTLWYRPPELLMGSTSYGASADLWSVGCVFAELLTGRPLLKGRTEVEQLHKIFKFCGSPPDEFWRQFKLPNATMFRPQHSYESSLRERCKDFPATAVDLIETFLSIEPEKRGTASSALVSQYFTTRPFACDPSSFPKYPPNKEMDAKCREETRRKKDGGRLRDPKPTRKPRRVHKTLQEQINIWNGYDAKEEENDGQYLQKTKDSNARTNKGGRDMNRQQSFDGLPLPSQVVKGHHVFTGPAPVTASNSFAWAKRQKDDRVSTVSYDQSVTSTQLTADSSRFNFANSSFDLKKREHETHNSREITSTHLVQKQNRSYMTSSPNTAELEEHGNKTEKVEFSGATLSESKTTMEGLLQRNASQKCQAIQKSKLDKEMLCKVLLH